MQVPLPLVQTQPIHLFGSSLAATVAEFISNPIDLN